MASEYNEPTPVEVSVFVENGNVVFRLDASTLYVYDKDGVEKSNCAAACARIWIPLAAPQTASPIGDWSPIARADGTRQWAYKGRPVYSYSHDSPGEKKGEGLDGLWHVLRP